MGIAHCCEVNDSNVAEAPKPDQINHHSDSEEEKENAAESKPLAELKVVDTKKKMFATEGDKYDKFEESLPFGRTYVRQFESYINATEKECGGEGFVTIEALAQKLGTSEAWSAQFKDPDSKLNKILNNSAFKNEEKGHRADQIDAQYLICLGLLLCASESKDFSDKAEVFYALLQEGGITKHTFISASDKDFPPIIEKLCRLATVELFEFAREFAGIECPYSEEDLTKLAEIHETIREEKLLEDVYGNASKLDNKEWLEAVSKNGKWILNSKTLRQEVFKHAKVAYVAI